MTRSFTTLRTKRPAGPVDRLRAARRGLDRAVRAALRRLRLYLPDLSAWGSGPAPVPVPVRHTPAHRDRSGGGAR